MIDETTLIRALAELAADPPTATAPATEAKRRAKALQRHRRTGVVGVVALLAVGVLAVVHVASSPGATAPGGKQQPPSTSEQDPNHPTSATVVKLDAKTGATLWTVYWQGTRLCERLADFSECAGVEVNPAQPVTLVNLGDQGDPWTFAFVGDDVTSVKVTRPDGTSTVLKPVTGNGFTAPVVVADGKVMSLRAFDTNGKQVGQPVRGRDALQLLPVMTAQPCAVNPTTANLLELPLPDHPTQCLGVDSSSGLTVLPSSANAQDDTDIGWEVSGSLTVRDGTAFADLTGRLSKLASPRNQLAMVLDGKLLSAPHVQTEIDGGKFVITGGDKPFTQEQAEALAVRLSRY